MIKPWYKKVVDKSWYGEKHQISEIRIMSGIAMLPVIKVKIVEGHITDVSFVGFKSVRKSKDIKFLLENHELFLQWLDLINVVEFFDQEKFLIPWLEQPHTMRIEDREVEYRFEKRGK